MRITTQEYIQLDLELNDDKALQVEYWIRDKDDDEGIPNAVKLGDLVLTVEDIQLIAKTAKFLDEESA